jgi:hypothetical protein
MPDFYVMSDGRHRRTPLMLAAFAGVIHDRQRTNGNKRKSDRDDDQWGVHGDLAAAGSIGLSFGPSK